MLLLSNLFVYPRLPFRQTAIRVARSATELIGFILKPAVHIYLLVRLIREEIENGERLFGQTKLVCLRGLGYLRSRQIDSLMPRSCNALHSIAGD